MAPPLNFRRIDEGGHVWRMFCDYFRHVQADTREGWHPLSTHLGRVIESTAASLDTELLALGVAVEGIAGECFPLLAPASPAFLAELDLVQAAVNGLTLTLQSRNRIDGTINAMRSARNSDIIRAFIGANNLPTTLYRAWNRIRNASAHGGGIQGTDVAELIALKDQVLSLLYSLTLAAIHYSGPRTDYGQFGWPQADWPVPVSATTTVLPSDIVATEPESSAPPSA